MTAPAAFADPARDGARAFRAILDAMARPGRTFVPPRPAETAPGLSQAATAVVLTLVDGDARLWTAPRLASPALEGWLRFWCGASPEPDPARAAFAVGRWSDLVAVGGWAQGSPAYPDRSATLIVEVDALTEGVGATLRGPGVETTHRLDARGVDASFWAERAAARAAFPLGADVILTAGDRLAALPRSARVDFQSMEP